MDVSIQKALNDKLYDKRKLGALDLERLIRECLSTNNHDRIAKIIDQLCDDYAYTLHQPYARNGGLIGLAAASIALGPAVAPYLEKIVPPVLACFGDQDARVRYYACESMYNIAKTSKGEILPYFNEVFDALAKLAADPELSVKNGAELLDRLVKDIISDSATAYVSALHTYKDVGDEAEYDDGSPPTAFSLPRFIPLLKERVYVTNPWTRMFLVNWISLLDSIPDLELVSYLPDFLGGLFRFLNDSNQDVVTSTQHLLEKFLDEIKSIAKVQRTFSDNAKLSKRLSHNPDALSSYSISPGAAAGSSESLSPPHPASGEGDRASQESPPPFVDETASTINDEYLPGQDIHVNHARLLDILLSYLEDSQEEHVQLTALRWIDSFFDICPEEMLAFVSKLLAHVLPCLSSDIEQVRVAGSRVNSSLTDYIIMCTEEEEKDEAAALAASTANNISQSGGLVVPSSKPSVSSVSSNQPQQGRSGNLSHEDRPDSSSKSKLTSSSDERPTDTASLNEGPQPRGVSGDATNDLKPRLDYQAAVNALTMQFLHEHEATRVAALSWLIMLQSKAPKKVLSAQDGTFPALLKTLADTSDAVVTRDLQLLSQISKNSDDSYFTFFMVNLLKLFATDRRLLESRGNLIIRQLCLNLSPERIYRTMADCLEKEEDVEYASIMVSNLNNNLITAPELADLRRKLRHWDTRGDGQGLFVVLFKAWSHNAIATVTLCLLAQAYEQAYNILQIFADIEMDINMLIQIDKLVQLLESPVFTYLRLQLLEPERYPYLYKCLYAIMMLLPQSAAFAALKNRLNAVSAIGYLYTPGASRPATSTTGTQFDRPNRIKARDEGPIKWSELLERFRNAQDRARRSDGRRGPGDLDFDDQGQTLALRDGSGKAVEGTRGSTDGRLPVAGSSASSSTAAKETSHRSKLSVGNFGRFAKSVKGTSKK